MTKTNYAVEIEQVLHWSRGLKYTQQLLRDLWIAPQPRCLIASVERLAFLTQQHPDCFLGSGAAKPDELFAWATAFKRMLRQLPGHESPALVAMLKVDPIDAVLQKSWGDTHPLYGYLSDFPIHSLLLVTPPPHSASLPGFDRLVSLILGTALREHQLIAWDDYYAYLDTYAKAKSAKSTLPESPLRGLQRLQEADRAIRTLQRLTGLDEMFSLLSSAKTSAAAADIVGSFSNKLGSSKDSVRIRLQLLGLVRSLRDQPIREVTRTSNTGTSRREPAPAKAKQLAGLVASLDMGLLPTYLSISQLQDTLQLQTTITVLPL